MEAVCTSAASVNGPSEPVIVWYQAVPTKGSCGYNNGAATLFRAWSDGTIEMKTRIQGAGCDTCGNSTYCDWQVISSPQMACRTDINGNGEIELGDLLAVLGQWGDQATCPDTVQLQCGFGLPTS